MQRRLLLAFLAAPALARAQDRSVRLVVPFGAGGNTDAIARVLAPRLAELLGQPVVVENRPSASGVIGAEYVSRAAPDGQTFMMHDTTFPVMPSLHKRLPFDVETGFTLLGCQAAGPTTMVVRANLPAQNLREVVALARANPGTVSYATGSTGGTAHLAGLLLEQVAGIRLNHLAYAGAGQAMNDLAGGHIDMTFSALSSVQSLVESGKVRAIATSGAERLPTAPNLPTFRESGVDVVVSANWCSYAPAGTPPAAAARLAEALASAIATPAINAELTRRGFVPLHIPASGHAASLHAEVTQWGAVIRRAGIQAE